MGFLDIINNTQLKEVICLDYWYTKVHIQHVNTKQRLLRVVYHHDCLQMHASIFK